MNENVWLKAEQNQARRERIRYLITGRIKTNTVPNVLINTVDGWRFPSLKAS